VRDKSEEKSRESSLPAKPARGRLISVTVLASPRPPSHVIPNHTHGLVLGVQELRVLRFPFLRVDFQWRRALASGPRDETLDEQAAAVAATVGTGTRKEAMKMRRKTASESFEEES